MFYIFKCITVRNITYIPACGKYAIYNCIIYYTVCMYNIYIYNIYIYIYIINTSCLNTICSPGPHHNDFVATDSLRLTHMWLNFITRAIKNGRKMWVESGFLSPLSSSILIVLLKMENIFKWTFKGISLAQLQWNSNRMLVNWLPLKSLWNWNFGRDLWSQTSGCRKSFLLIGKVK